jgi:LacI family transcriptional regulator
VEAAHHFLTLPEPPDAIFCFQDTLAVGCIRALRQAGKQIPRDIAVAGFDNTELAEYSDPQLTSVDQPFF